MFKLYNIVWQAVSGKLHASQIPVGPAHTRWGLCMTYSNIIVGISKYFSQYMYSIYATYT